MFGTFVYNLKSIFRLLNSVRLDYQYGGRYLGKSLANENKLLGYVYTGSTSYAGLRDMFSIINLKPSDVIVDVGCGKGRTFNWLLHQQVSNPLIGIEVDPDVAAFTRKRLSRYPQVDIITGDFRDCGFPDNASVFYFY